LYFGSVRPFNELTIAIK